MKRKIISSWKLWIRWMIVCSGIIVCAAGCEKSTELEDREYVLALGIDLKDDGISVSYDVSQFFKEGADSSQEGGQTGGEFTVDGFYDLASAYGNQSENYLDLNHLKAVIIGKKLAQNQEKMIELLQYIEKNELFARNVKVFIADNEASDIFALGENLSSSVGEYLESLYLDSNYYVEEQSTDIGKLFSHWHNYDEILLIPILSQEKDKPAVSGYAVMQEVMLRAQMSEEEGELVYLGNGVRLQTNIITDSLYAIELDKVKSKINFTDNGLMANLDLNLKGHVTNQQIEDSRIRAEVEAQVEQKLELSYIDFWIKWQPEQIDFFHTFSKLSTKNRKMWLDYRNRRAEYNQNMQVKVDVKVELEDD